MMPGLFSAMIQSSASGKPIVLQFQEIRRRYDDTIFAHTGVNFGTPNPLRKIIVAWVTRSGMNDSFTGVTIGGVPAQIASSTTIWAGLIQNFGFAIAQVPFGNTGTVEFISNGSPSTHSFMVWSAIGEFTQPLTPSLTVTPMGNAITRNSSRSVSKDGFVISVCSTINATPRSHTWTELNEDADSPSGGVGGLNLTSASKTYEFDTTSNFSCTQTGSFSGMHMFSCSWR